MATRPDTAHKMIPDVPTHGIAYTWPATDREWARSHVGCNVTTCPNSKCASTGQCQDVAAQHVEISERHESPLKAIADDMAAGTARFVSPPLVPRGYGKGYCSDPCDVTTCGCSPAVTPPRTIIAFTGLAGAGKSTAAMHLVNHRGFTKIRFAGPLKAMMTALGCTAREVDGDLKETPCDLLGGRTPRHAMQTLGTEWGRDLITPDLWIRAWQAALVKVPAGVPVVVDDCRFPNEAAAVTNAGGILVRVERPRPASEGYQHSSETHQLPAAATLHNTLSEQNLREQVDVLLRDLSWAAA